MHPINIHDFQEFHPLALLPLLLLVTLAYIVTCQHSTTNKNKPPSPPTLPIIGNLHQLGTHPHRALQTLARKYGDLMYLRLGSRPTLVVSSSEYASEVLKTHDLAFASRPNLRVVTRLLGNGKDVLLSPYGEYWKQLRSVCVTQLLSGKRVRSFRVVREEEVGSMIAKIRGVKTVNLSEAFVSLSTDVICRVAFGRKYGGGERGGVDFNELLNEITKLLGGHYIGDYVGWLAWVDWLNGVDAKVSRVTKKFDEFLEGVIREHKERRRGGGDENEMVTKHLVDVLLDAQSDGIGSGSFSFDNESIKALILDIFVGGSDTTYISLEWIMSELIRNPRVMTQLQKEVRGVVGDKETVTEDDLETMSYLRAVIKEALRLHPPSPLMAPHLSTKDLKIKGYEIPEGTLAMVNVFAINRHPELWDEPESFYPERFMDSLVDFKGQDFQFIPFGSGRRICPGLTFATSSIEIALANLVHQFEWKLPIGASGETLEVAEAPGITVHRKNPLVVVPIPRMH